MNIPFGPPGPSRTAVPRAGGGGLVSQILAGRRAGPMRPIPRAQAGAGASGGVAWGGQVFHSPEDLVNFINAHGGNAQATFHNHPGILAAFGQRPVQPGGGGGPFGGGDGQGVQPLPRPGHVPPSLEGGPNQVGEGPALEGGPTRIGGIGPVNPGEITERYPGPGGLSLTPGYTPDGSEFGQQASPFPLPHPVVGGAAAHVGQILGGGNQNALHAIARGRQVAQAMQHLHRLVNHPALRHVRPIR